MAEKESLINGLSKCFSIDKHLIRQLLNSNNGDVAKILHLLEQVSPKTSKGDKKVTNEPGNSKGQSTSKGKPNTKNKQNNSDNDKSKTSGINKASKVKNNVSVSIGKEDSKVGIKNSDPWTLVEIEKKASKKKKKRGKSPVKSCPVKSSPVAGSSNMNPEKTPIFKPGLNELKGKRAEVKSFYEIIKLKQNEVDRIRDCIKCDIRVVVLMRGCPGSGKSTFARQLLCESGIINTKNHIFSSDNFFMDAKGNYNYNSSNLEQAHAWNQNLVEKLMKCGYSPIIVDNTNIRSWEMKVYAEFAVKQGYVLETLQPPTPWFFNESILAKKNIHGVPKHKISLMLENYEANLSGNDLLKKLKIDYKVEQRPPQISNYNLDQVLQIINKNMLGKVPVVPKVPLANSEAEKKVKRSSTDIKVTQRIPVQKSNLYPSSENWREPSHIIDRANTFQKQLHHNLIASSRLKNDDTNSESSNDCFEKVQNNPVLLRGGMVSDFSRFPQPYNFTNQQMKEFDDVNLIDNPIDGELASSLLPPLTPQSNIYPPGNVATTALNKNAIFDPSEFPSLSSNALPRINSECVSEICEENIKKVTELFPHLDKEFIRDMCGDPNIHIDTIIESLLESNLGSEVSSQSNNVIADCENDESTDEDVAYNSSSDEEVVDENIGSDKDMIMLIQLFPNHSEKLINEIYLKCNNEFRDALEELLNIDQKNSHIINEGANCKATDNDVQDVVKSQPNENIFHSENEVEITDTEKFETKTNTSLLKCEKLQNEVESMFNRIDIIVKQSKCYENQSLKDDVSLVSNIKHNENNNIAEDIQENITQDDAINSNISFCKNDENSYEIPVSNLETVNSQIESSKEIPVKKKNIFSVDSIKSAINKVLASIDNKKVGESDSSLSLTASGSNNDVDNSKSELMTELLSWNFKQKPLSDSIKDDECEPKDQREKVKSGLHNSATNTNYKDFELLKKAQTSDITDVKVICGSMDFVSCTEPIGKYQIPTDKLMLDKGVTTVDVESEFIGCYNGNSSILASLFPKISQEDLESLLKSCVGDLNWAVCLLLDSGHEISTSFNPSDHNFEIDGILNLSQLNIETKSDTLHSDVENPVMATSSDSAPVAKSKKRNGRIPVSVEQLNFVMSDESISDHVKKIRNARLGLECAEVQQDTLSHIEPDSFAFDSSEDDEREEETLAVALNTDFILSLQAQFGGFIPSVLPGNQVLVNLPVSLARQLHLCISDSLTQQLEEEDKLMKKIIEEDETFARQLQDFENGVTTQPQTIKEIMDEELALNIHHSLNKSKSNENTMAGKLTRQLLIERYPSMDPVALKSLLDDTNYSLHQASELLETAGYSSNIQNTPQPLEQGERNQLSREEAIEQSNAYRDAAKKFFQMRQDCFMKAQKAYSEGMKHVASYYSQMAHWHNERIEQANLLASTMLMTGCPNAFTVDLHFLRVCEAIQVLDLFIDSHVRNLIDTKKRKCEVYIITGRGLHSLDGKSKIKPATISKLNQRSIQYKILNPGLLLALLTYKTPLTYQNY